ncbi:MAG: potassium-transporting ATPase subunit KdpA [Candidatus Zhuqueibacterota bacterium]
MVITTVLQVMLLIGTLVVLAVPVGHYLTKVFTGSLKCSLEKWFYRLLGIDETREMSWKTYAFSLLVFNVIGIVAMFVLQLAQSLLPLNPQKFGAVRWDTALNTAISFVTNTNWQAYSGEATMSYFTQMLGMTVQNFLSAAVGMAASIAFIRGFIRKTSEAVGSFWVDLTRSILYVLLPLSILLSLIFVSQGMIQNFKPYLTVKTLEGHEQVIAQGPVASQEAIKQLGTNGGGFFNANASHPYENPTPLTDYLEIIGLLLIAAALPLTFGAMLKNRKQGWAIFAAMLILYLVGLTGVIMAEFQSNPILAEFGIERGANMEGKEVRFGRLASVVFAQSTTTTSCGAVNSMHDSFMPLTGLVLLFNIMVGEAIFGGVGVGLISMLMYAILTMFLVGLMIGRTPEIFGKKLEPYEMIMAVIAIVLPSVIQLLSGAIAASSSFGLSSLNNAGPHGLSEILYAFASGAGNNGSAFAGLNANTIFYNLTLAFAMLVGRFSTIIPALAIAGSLAKKKMTHESSRFPTDSPLFVIILISTVLIVGALTFFPVLVLGPILEHLALFAGKVF